MVMEDKLEVFDPERFFARCDRASALAAKLAKNFLILFIGPTVSSAQKSGFFASVLRKMKETRRLRFVISYLIPNCVGGISFAPIAVMV